jgi:hypothetical protein
MMEDISNFKFAGVLLQMGQPGCPLQDRDIPLNSKHPQALECLDIHGGEDRHVHRTTAERQRDKSGERRKNCRIC